MNFDYIFIIVLLIVIIVLLAILVKKNSNNGSHDSQGKDSDISSPKLSSAGGLPSFKDIPLSDVNEIVLQNSLGQELVIQRSAEVEDVLYKEIELDSTGNVIQHVGQGATEVYALTELNNIANTELYTSEVSRKVLLDNYMYTNGKISSIQFRSLDGTNIRRHDGFDVFDSAAATRSIPFLSIATAMQGMAIVSGQYFLKQINESLKSIGEDIEELKEIQESNTRGILRHCRNRLMQISNTQHCSKEDIIEIRDLANKAGVILEQYKERYEKALMAVRQYSFDSMIVDVALDKYRERLLKARYLLQVCMVADRIVDEARLTEYVTRRKIDINDPALDDVYTLMEDNYHNGFNATINKDAGKLKEMITERGRAYLGDTYSSSSTDLLLEPVDKCVDEIEADIFDITNSVRRIIDNQKQKERIAILFDKGDGRRPRFFVESHDTPNDLEYIEATE